MCLFQGLLHSFIVKFLLYVDLQREDDDMKSEIEKHLKVFRNHYLINQPEKAELPRMQKQYNVFFFLHVMIKNKRLSKKSQIESLLFLIGANPIILEFIMKYRKSVFHYEFHAHSKRMEKHPEGLIFWLWHL